MRYPATCPACTRQGPDPHHPALNAGDLTSWDLRPSPGALGARKQRAILSCLRASRRVASVSRPSEPELNPQTPRLCVRLRVTKNVLLDKVFDPCPMNMDLMRIKNKAKHKTPEAWVM